MITKPDKNLGRVVNMSTVNSLDCAGFVLQVQKLSNFKSNLKSFVFGLRMSYFDLMKCGDSVMWFLDFYMQDSGKNSICISLLDGKVRRFFLLT